MPNVAVLATIADHSTVSKTLTVGPYNISVSSANPGVPIESVHVVESGPGGVSSMEFTIIDLGTAIVMDEGYQVDFWDVAREGPIFKGFVQSWSYRPLPVGRAIEVRCTGIDAVLDWAMVPNLTIPTGTNTTAAIQACWGAVAGVGVALNVTSATDGSTNAPIATLASFFLAYDVVITNQTFRDAVQSVFDGTDWRGSVFRAVMWGDMWGGVRAQYDAPTSGGGDRPGDYIPNFVVYDQSGGVIGGTLTPNELDMTTDAGAVPHQVYVTGSNAAGTGLVSDGTGLPGPIASLSDDTSDTGTKRDLIGQGYLASLQATVRASLALENRDPVIGPANVADTMERAGTFLTMELPRVGEDQSVVYRVASISKTFLSNGNEDWVINFGGQAKSAIRSTRRLTRDTRS